MGRLFPGSWARELADSGVSAVAYLLKAVTPGSVQAIA